MKKGTFLGGSTFLSLGGIFGKDSPGYFCFLQIYCL